MTPTSYKLLISKKTFFLSFSDQLTEKEQEFWEFFLAKGNFLAYSRVGSNLFPVVQKKGQPTRISTYGRRTSLYWCLLWAGGCLFCMLGFPVEIELMYVVSLPKIFWPIGFSGRLERATCFRRTSIVKWLSWYLYRIFHRFFVIPTVTSLAT